ncbi:DNA methyltransferase [Pseudoalteromonas sp. NEC-BIFX-2020_015]|uniref:DNA methyltransferase n=1 Tax=Pseudoalteromonas sp. NEC-BIFX-2020_015 TaxID=2729544 RepID=UPI0014613B9C|nr:DNA methyltransferase [Pseudoalteromonas sp. NEC-BIFX-2020_015]
MNNNTFYEFKAPSDNKSDHSKEVTANEQSIDLALLSFITTYKLTKQAIEVDFRELVNWVPYSDSYTHYVHAYPAKLLKHIPIFFLNSNYLLPEKNSYVLDPFCGSGTVLLEALLSGHNAFGCDANPLARLIAKVKTTKLNSSKLQKELDSVLASAKRLRKFLPINVVNINHWFPKITQRDLSRIARSIEQLADSHEKDFLKVTFSNVVKKVSYADPNLSVPVKLKPEKYKNPEYKSKAQKKLAYINNLSVFTVFEKQFKDNLKRIKILEDTVIDAKATVISKDARKITESLELPNKKLPNETVDLILTSPPYAGAQKYIRSSSLSLGWLGFCEKNSLRDFERENIGREHYSKSEYETVIQTGIADIDNVLNDIWHINRLRAHINGNYLLEMQNAISEMYRVLKKNKYCIIIIGNNEVCGKQFDTQRFIRLIAEKIGFTTELVLVDDIHSRGLMTKRNKTASVINSEWILVFKK